MVNHDLEFHGASLRTESPEQTRSVARAIGRRCAGGETILLYGDLGSGKTCFVQGLAHGLGVPSESRVTSPTFTLHAEYQGRLVLNHLDLYRLDDSQSLEGLGIDEMLMDAEAVTAIEWPEIMEFPVNKERLEVKLVDLGEGCREIALSAYGAAYGRLLAAPLLDPAP